jgi:hypothetical protein
MGTDPSIIFQSAKLGNCQQILAEFRRAERLLQNTAAVGRIYGVSGGALPALAFSLALSARLEPHRWQPATDALRDFATYLQQSPSRAIRSFNLNPAYGPFNLNPLRQWILARMMAYTGKSGSLLSELPVPLYLAALDWDATFTLFGPPDSRLQSPYHFGSIGPPQDAPVVDALVASLSTILSTSPATVNGAWYRDARPAVVDAGAIVADLESADPRPIQRSRPFTPLRNWKSNWITTSFNMHSFHERNQPLLASYYLDLLDKDRQLTRQIADFPPVQGDPPDSPKVCHINLPYIGSTEAFTNMRESVAHKDSLMAKFGQLLEGQLDQVPFDQTANLIYGAGGFSGILAGLVTTRAVNQGFSRGGGHIQHGYGVSAGGLNGFFHAIQLAAQRRPDLYRPPALQALADLEAFIATIDAKKVGQVNLNPLRFWQGWGNLGPLRAFLLERLAAYTGASNPAALTFDEIALPMTVTATRRDGFTEYFGMTRPERKMIFGEHTIAIHPAPVVDAVIAGWSMNTYVEPGRIQDECFEDGGGAFYDIGLFSACLDEHLTNLINIHLDEPEGHSYHLPARPNLLRIIFDTHNYTFPEERRRMFHLTNLLYRHFAHRAEYQRANPPLPPDFRRTWIPANRYCEEP